MASSTLPSLANQEATASAQMPYSPQQAQPSGEERTHDDNQGDGDAQQQRQPAPDEVTCTEDEQKHLLDCIDKYTERYGPIRRKRIRQVLRAREYFKGNQYISFDSDNFTWFDPIDALFDGNPDKEDASVYRYTNNVYQMLALSFVAALSPQVPKTQYMPADAERLEDTATAKAASTLEQVIERQNNIKNLQKLELLYLWTDGCYFSYVRFLVDGDRAGTHREPEIDLVSMEVMPARFECSYCDATVPAAQVSAMTTEPTCPNCGETFSPSDFYLPEMADVPKVVSYNDVPNGMVTIGTYGVLNIVAAPYANELWESPMLRFDLEVDLASLRESYSEKWEELKGSGNENGSNAESINERMARQQVMSMVGGRNTMTSDEMPTLSRTWLQPWALNTIDDRTIALGLKKKFPEGVMVVHTGRLFLEARKSRVRDHWSWCGMVKGFGLNPPGIGDVVLDVQDRINDASNTITEHMDRSACPPVLVDGGGIDTKKMNNKPMLAGTMTEVPKKGAGMNRPLRDLVHQVTVTMDAHIYDYVDKMVMFAQLVSGVLPQIFGGSDPNVKTAQGQKQQLNVALGRLGLFWDNIREEHAIKAGLSIRCAAKNYTDDILNVVAGGDKDFRNEYVRINDLSGEFHSYPETDQGFPQTYAEIQQRLETMMAEGADNPLFMELMDEPVNQKQLANYLLPANFITPKEADRAKCSAIIQKLLGQRPSQLPDPVSGAVVQVPSILVDEDYDLPEVIQKVVRQWAIENYALQEENPDGWDNVLLYYRMAAQITALKAAQAQAESAAAAGPPPAPGGAEGGAPPPPQ